MPRFTHRDLDGEWCRLLPDGTLEMRDPNSGLGWDAADKPRFQYRVRDGVAERRRLPPESVGDVWRGEDGPPEWEPMAGLPPGQSVLSEYLRHCGG